MDWIHQLSPRTSPSRPKVFSNRPPFFQLFTWHLFIGYSLSNSFNLPGLSVLVQAICPRPLPPTPFRRVIHLYRINRFFDTPVATFRGTLPVCEFLECPPPHSRLSPFGLANPWSECFVPQKKTYMPPLSLKLVGFGFFSFLYSFSIHFLRALRVFHDLPPPPLTCLAEK